MAWYAREEFLWYSKGDEIPEEDMQDNWKRYCEEKYVDKKSTTKKEKGGVPEDKEVMSEDKVLIEEKRGDDGKFSETDLMDLKKRHQVMILRDLGLSSEEIDELGNEPNRVEKILELQEE